MQVQRAKAELMVHGVEAGDNEDNSGAGGNAEPGGLRAEVQPEARNPTVEQG